MRGAVLTRQINLLSLSKPPSRLEQLAVREIIRHSATPSAASIFLGASRDSGGKLAGRLDHRQTGDCHRMAQTRLSVFAFVALSAGAARVIGRSFALCHTGCALRRGSAVGSAETLRRLVGRFCAKSRSVRQEKEGGRLGQYLSPSTVVTILLLGHPTLARNDEVQLPRRNDCVDCRAFCRFRGGAIQYGERRSCPNRPTGFAARRPENSSTPRQSEPPAQAKAGR